MLLLMRVSVAPRWHLKVWACGWLADLHGNRPDTAPGPTASAALLPPAVPSATSLILADHLLWRSSIRLYLFHISSLRPSQIDRCIDPKRPTRADVWESVYFFSNWIGKAADFGWVCTWESVCLLIEWMSWSVMEMKLGQTGSLLVSTPIWAGSATRCCW